MFTREMISNTDETPTVKPMFLRFSSVYKKQEKNEYILLREVKLNFYDLMLFNARLLPSGQMRIPMDYFTNTSLGRHKTISLNICAS